MSALSDGQKKRQDRVKLTGGPWPSSPSAARARTYATCPVCGRHREVRIDGSIESHTVRLGGMARCDGSGRQPRTEVRTEADRG